MVTSLSVAITESTCGDPCWGAREDVCRCSCGGKNHGIFRTGERPERMRKLNGYVYTLQAVESYELRKNNAPIVSMRPMEDLSRQICRAARDAGLCTSRQSCFTGDPGAPAKLKTASEFEINRWPELVAWKGDKSRPLTLWARADIVQAIGG